jgi:hypothetical protein
METEGKEYTYRTGLSGDEVRLEVTGGRYPALRPGSCAAGRTASTGLSHPHISKPLCVSGLFGACRSSTVVAAVGVGLGVARDD